MADDSPTVTAKAPAVQMRGATERRAASLDITPEHPGRYRTDPDERGSSEVGRGGCGRVLAVFDRHLGRTIALKELSPPDGADTMAGGSSEYTPAQASRFLREARVTAGLIHPNIVPVYELGTRPDGALYYTMRLVKGVTLKEALRRTTTFSDRLALLPHFVDVCHAIAFAHSRGVIHRDLKPDNVMLGEFGETLVLDWGLAKTLEGDVRPGDPSPVADSSGDAVTSGSSARPGLTMDGSFMGTPAYVSPEQALGRLDEVDAKSDVWSLGAILYELLTGSQPYPGRSAQEVLARVLSEEVKPPRALVAGIPPELASVCAKALSRPRRERYGSAKEIAEEIEAFRSGRRVLAHEYSALEHLKRFAAANRRLIAAAAAVFAVTVAALVVVAVSYSHEVEARRAAQEATAREKAARVEEHAERLRSNFHFAEGAQEKAERLADERRLGASRIYAAASLLRNPAFESAPMYQPNFAARFPESRPLALRALSLAFRGAVDAHLFYERTLRADGPLNRVAFSPDGARIAAAGKDGSVVVWSAADGRRELAFPAHSGSAWALSFNADGTAIATGGADGAVRLFESRSGRRVSELEAQRGDVFDIAFTPDGALVSAGHDGTVRVFDVETGARRAVFVGHDGPVHGVAVSPDGRRIASAGRDRTVRIWPATNGSESMILRGHSAVVRDVEFSPDGALLVSASYDRTARLWDANTGEELFAAGGHGDEVLQAAFSKDGTRFLTASWDRAVRVFDVASRSLLATAEGFSGAAWSAAFSPGDGRVAAASEDGTVRLWSVRAPAPAMYVPGQGYVWTTVFSPDGTAIASAGADGTVRLWDPRTGRLRAAIPGSEDMIPEICFAPDGRRIAAGGYDGAVRVLDREGGTVDVLDGHTGIVRSVDIDPKGELLASGGDDGTVRVRRFRGGEIALDIEAHRGPVRRVRFSPDGRRLFSAGDDGRLRVFDVSTGAEIASFDAGRARVTGIGFSPRGRLAITSFDGGLLLFEDAGHLESPRRLSRGAAGLYAVRLSADGELLATAGDDGVVAIWSWSRGEVVLQFSCSQSAVSVDFSPDGRELVFGDSNVVRAYGIHAALARRSPERMLEEAQREAGLALEGFTLVPRDREAKR